MRAYIQVSTQQLKTFKNYVRFYARQLVDPVQAAMTERYSEIVHGNFGMEGIDRPTEWPPLSPRYARKVKRSFATLYVSGNLYSAVKTDTEAANVSVSNADVPYATAHQFGNPSNNLPARPYFPMTDDGQPTPLTVGMIQDAARAELLSLLGGDV